MREPPTRSRTHQFHVGDILADDTQAVEDAGGDDDRRAVLIVVEDWNIEQLFELVLDDEAVRRLDVLEIDAAEGGTEVANRVDESVDVFCRDEEVDRNRYRRSV